ncbi:MAG: hypothetical protein PVS2B2_24730 [Candidatus Acidiferrum sp.]
MLLLAKVALGIGATLAMATAYTFHEGVIHVDVDEAKSEGTHLHLWVPATVVPVALLFAPKQHLRDAAERAKPFLPAIRILSKDLEKYPDADLIEVREENQHVQIHTEHGSVRIDVDSPDEVVHLRVPIKTLRHISGELEADAPAE